VILTSSRDGLDVKLIHSIGNLREIENVWNDFIEEIDGDIYFHTKWLGVWLKHYGNGREFVAVMVTNGKELVAALPFVIQQFGLWPFGVRVAKLAGSDFTISVFDPAIRPGFEAAVLGVAFGALIEVEKCDLVSLSPMTTLGAWQGGVGSGKGAIFSTEIHEAGVCTVFDLPDSFDEYLAGLKKQARSNYRRDLRQIIQYGHFEQRIERGEGAITAFDQFVDLHGRQWQAVNQPGHFREWPASEDFNRDLVKAYATEDKVRFFVISCDGAVISSQYCFFLGSRCYWRLPARTISERWEKLGLGRIGLVKMIEALIQDGVRKVEAGPGRYDYKRRHGGKECPAVKVLGFRKGSIAYSRAKIALSLSNAIDYLYYRIWYIKISRFLGMKSNKLNNIWLSTRF
jgi:CelD/BcsL family acetyltransferase involved in cellulose biosynthesis